MLLDDCIDLHGYYKADAIKKLAEDIEVARQRNFRSVTVITGQGIHSTGPSVLRPAVIQFAEDQKIMWSPVTGNLGRIKLYLGEDAEIDRDVESAFRNASGTKFNPALSWCVTISCCILVFSMFFVMGRFMKLV